MTGPEKLHLFTKLNTAKQFPKLKNKDHKQEFWTKLIDINQLLSTKPSEMTNDLIKNFESESRHFVNKFVELYPSKHVTPYMHCMCNHVHEFMAAHGSILQFT